jgi:hypothetical protein
MSAAAKARAAAATGPDGAKVEAEAKARKAEEAAAAVAAAAAAMSAVSADYELAKLLDDYFSRYGSLVGTPRGNIAAQYSSAGDEVSATTRHAFAFWGKGDPFRGVNNVPAFLTDASIVYDHFHEIAVALLGPTKEVNGDVRRGMPLATYFTDAIITSSVAGKTVWVDEQVQTGDARLGDEVCARILAGPTCRRMLAIANTHAQAKEIWPRSLPALMNITLDTGRQKSTEAVAEALLGTKFFFQKSMNLFQKTWKT